MGWDAIVKAGLTNDTESISPGGLRYSDWSAAVKPFVTEQNKEMLGFLGLFDDGLVPANARTSADILQFLCEHKLAIEPGDKDMIVMLHQFEYELAGKQHQAGEQPRGKRR